MKILDNTIWSQIDCVAGKVEQFINAPRIIPRFLFERTIMKFGNAVSVVYHNTQYFIINDYINNQFLLFNGTIKTVHKTYQDCIDNIKGYY